MTCHACFIAISVMCVWSDLGLDGCTGFHLTYISHSIQPPPQALLSRAPPFRGEALTPASSGSWLYECRTRPLGTASLVHRLLTDSISAGHVPLALPAQLRGTQTYRDGKHCAGLLQVCCHGNQTQLMWKHSLAFHSPPQSRRSHSYVLCVVCDDSLCV